MFEVTARISTSTTSVNTEVFMTTKDLLIFRDLMNIRILSSLNGAVERLYIMKWVRIPAR